MDDEEIEIKKNRDDMAYNINLEKMLTKIISSKLKKYYPDTKLEVHFTSFKNGDPVLKRSFHNTPDDYTEAYFKGFPRHGAFKPNGIRITYDEDGSRGVVEFKASNSRFIPTDDFKMKKFLNLGFEPNRQDIVNLINSGIKEYNKLAVHDKYGKYSREESRKEKPGLYHEEKLNILGENMTDNDKRETVNKELTLADFKKIVNFMDGYADLREKMNSDTTWSNRYDNLIYNFVKSRIGPRRTNLIEFLIRDYQGRDSDANISENDIVEMGNKIFGGEGKLNNPGKINTNGHGYKGPKESDIPTVRKLLSNPKQGKPILKKNVLKPSINIDEEIENFKL